MFPFDPEHVVPRRSRAVTGARYGRGHSAQVEDGGVAGFEHIRTVVG